MSSGRRPYISYLLRLWRVRDGAGFAWRASLQPPQSGECRGFANLDDLFAYLRQLTGYQEQGEARCQIDEGKEM